MADKETHMDANQEYIDAFNAEEAPDEAAMPPEGEQMSVEDVDAAQAELMQDDTRNLMGAEAGEGATDNASAVVSLTGEDEEAMTPEEQHRKRSWEGRQKKMEQDRRAKEASLNDGGVEEPSSTQSHIDHVSARYHSAVEAKRNGEEYDPQDLKNAEFLGLEGDDEPAKFADGGEVGMDMIDEAEGMDAFADDAVAGDEAGESVASILDDIKREASELAADPARLQATVQQMVDDFGREFVVAAAALAGPMVDVKAEGYITDVNSSMSSLVDDVTDALRSMHRSTIADAHEDFEDIVSGEDFQAYMDGLDEEAKARADQIIGGGSAGQIIKLLSQFKDSMKQSKDDASYEESWAEDAASGVKSSAPVRLPNRAPVTDEDEYRQAWNES